MLEARTLRCLEPRPDPVEVLVATNRPAWHNFVAGLAHSHEIRQPVRVHTAPLDPSCLSAFVQRPCRLNVAVVDVAISPSSAVAVCHEIRRLAPELAILGVLCCPEPVTATHVEALLTSGVTCLVDSQASLDDIRHAVEGLAAGRPRVNLQLAAQYGPVLVTARSLDHHASYRQRLSSRERQVAGMLINGTDKEIAAHLAISLSTIESHVRNLCFKLGATSRVQLGFQLAHQSVID